MLFWNLMKFCPRASTFPHKHFIIQVTLQYHFLFMRRCLIYTLTQNLLSKVYGWNWPTSSLILRLLIWYKIETFTSVSLWQLKVNGDTIFCFGDVIKNQFLVCEIHSSHVTKLMVSLIAIIYQGHHWCKF